MTIHIDERLEPDGAWRHEGCPIDAAVSVIGTRPTMLIIREAHYGTTRFHDFVGRTGLTGSVVASRLHELVQAQILATRPYREPGSRGREEYVLTARGEALLPVVLALAVWGSEQMLAGQWPVTVLDAGTGAAVALGLVEPNREVSGDSPLVFAPSPAGSALSGEETPARHRDGA
ncbi:winged helix-turn-helix transcriptional regulator [Gryllotalpicola protaetiae]|uniref:Transcriptional regulator n=1 Tax=Gryllotalpicola protaetiae TaxID=2419771 RepID=A0A387BSJ6_9MICO|nr:helix-turn-helix domain-containing protein [Gryllotalpicola protaetiae]AYG03907.1 transcriptional regulator [Gryllotalpicola protaetiae]